MSRAHAYRPRFVDIRIRPPGDEAEAEAPRCDWADCVGVGECRAPKGPDRLRDFYLFCPRHAAEYNKSWNFFAEMTEEQVRSYQAADSVGQRPTWNMRSDMGDRVRRWSRGRAGAQGANAGPRFNGGPAGGFFDAFDLFGGGARGERPRGGAHDPGLGKLEARALETLGFPGRTPLDEVRSRYAELVKRFHPDANGGDRSSEGRLQQVIHAYKTLKRAGMA
jgi:curved DNA-binding protein CbpA